MKTGSRHEATGNGKKVKFLGIALSAMLFALSAPTDAQQPPKVPRIGFLSATSPSIISTRVAAFRPGAPETAPPGWAPDPQR